MLKRSIPALLFYICGMSSSLGKKSPLSVLTGAFVWKVGERWKPVGGFVGDEAEIICSPSPHSISSRPPQPSPALCSFPRQSAGFGLPTTPCLVALSYLEGQRAVQSERLFLGRYHLNHPRPAVVPGAFCLGTAPQESWGGPTCPDSLSPACWSSDLTTFPTSLLPFISKLSPSLPQFWSLPLLWGCPMEEGIFSESC